MSAQTDQSPAAQLQERLAALSPRDVRRLGGQLAKAQRLDPEARDKTLTYVSGAIDASEQRLAARRAALPAISYPDELPVSQRRDDIAEAIRDHQVVIVAGETGSGKTTQIPKICLELGRGIRGLIGHTQPRRIAARTVAERIADELGTELGDAVGYTVRFTDHSSPASYLKLMTDGILLAEMQRDRDLLAYDTIIVDEAHERSLNIDFLLGYLKQLLPRRPDLHVIITSATIDSARFAEHFGTDKGPAPVIEVTGRMYPVETRYRPYGQTTEDANGNKVTDDRDQTQAICDAVAELAAEGPGDVLVFLSGEREIKDTAEALNALAMMDTTVVPLYARLSAAEQHKVFEPHRGRNIVLATNVAETSLTVPGIRYVVDPGTARISRYSTRLKVQRLPIEAVSQASANQRKGRCGRVADGICIRLYDEEDFLARPEYTDPEILRTNLASVILQMTALGLGDIAAFPFVDPPDSRNIRDGVVLLHELHAIEPKEQDPKKRLTPLGRKLSQLPVDPRLGRMVLEADTLGCVREVIVLAAVLSMQDPRERPTDKQQQADEKHARFADKTSDFLTFLNLWRYLVKQQKELSSSAFRRMCRTDFLNYLRIREWQDLESQLRQVAKRLDVTINESPASEDNLHQALLSGLLSHIGIKDGPKNEYLGARGARFAVFPGSTLARKSPTFVMAAELVETSRLWARTVAKIEPEWAERLGEHLVARSYSEPHWSRKRGGTVAYERVLLYGVPLIARRAIDYGRIDPALARELFIRNALVEGDWQTHHRFFAANRALLEDVEELEHRSRRRGLVVDEETLFEFYDKRIPADIITTRHFDTWWKKAQHEQRDLLTFTMDLVLNERAADVRLDDYPDVWRSGDLALPLTYQFEPGAAADGVTVHVPVVVLNRLSAEPFTWLVPGLRHELVTALIKSLPKQLRVQLVPAPDRAAEALTGLEQSDGSLLTELAHEFYERYRVDIAPSDWQLDRVPDHLRMTFLVHDDAGQTLGEGKDLDALRGKLVRTTTTAISQATQTFERSGLTTFPPDGLPRTVDIVTGGNRVLGYPALIDGGTTVDVKVLSTARDQQRFMLVGTRRLVLLAAPSPVAQLQRTFSPIDKLQLSLSPHGNVPDLLADCVACAADALIAAGGGPAWDAASFDALVAAVKPELQLTTLDVLAVVRRILPLANAVQRALDEAAPSPATADLRAQLKGLVYPGFIARTGRSRLTALERYLTAMQRRIDKLANDPGRDALAMATLVDMQKAYAEALASLAPGKAPSDELLDVRWTLEELRVSLFAQPMRTAYPVSPERIFRVLDAARD
ncbi:MAG: ATP-dependent helicase HrpA [Frankiales bacterium]|nr:ATP-dependent helicase HrpA [Frankiales bacterium]